MRARADALIKLRQTPSKRADALRETLALTPLMAFLRRVADWTGVMTTSFSGLLETAKKTPAALCFHITDDWLQGRTTYGGMSLALCYETVIASADNLPPLRSALVSFIGPAGGDVEGRAKILRQGKSVTFMEADLTGEKGLATRCAFAFGAARESRFSDIFTPAPEVPAAESCEYYIPPGMGPAFAQHFEQRLAKGGRPVSGSNENDHFIWVRHKDVDATSLAALLALADMPPPAVMPMFDAPAPISSMTWQVNLLTDAPRTKDGWWLLQSRAENASSGYSSQDMLVWNADLELTIAGRQSVAIFV